MNKKHLSFDDITVLTYSLCDNIEASGWQPSIVVGITRGGLLTAKMLSHYWKVPMCTIDVSLRDYTLWSEDFNTNLVIEAFNGHNLLVVDDINDSGATGIKIKNTWTTVVNSLPEHQSLWPKNNIKFGVLLENEVSSHQSDFWGSKINKEQDPIWYVFPWEIQRGKGD
jgi:hypoxanthine phosphoribosyltransferase